MKKEDAKTEGPTPAATVILMRECELDPFEIFLVKRHSKSRFMANAYVYPGGKLEEGDLSEALSYHCRGFLPQAIGSRLGIEEGEALGLHIAALRELFEEAGALFATESNGEDIRFDQPSESERYETYRAMLHEGEVDFEQIVGWEDLCLRIDVLTYFAHWITPENEPRRYDTRFFLARSPGNQELIHDAIETTDSIWLSPRAAIAAFERGEIQLAPPTLHTLTQLSIFSSIDAVISHFSEAQVPCVLPYVKSEGEDFILLLPGDVEYPEPAPVPVEGPSRVTLTGGRWWVPGPESGGHEEEPSE